MSRTWYCGVGDETHGEVPAPPLELWLPCTQQRECSLEHGRVAATDAFPPQQNSVPMPTQGSDCRSRQVSFLLRSLLASACSTTCSDERSLYCRLQDVTDKIMNAIQRKCSTQHVLALRETRGRLGTGAGATSSNQANLSMLEYSRGLAFDRPLPRPVQAAFSIRSRSPATTLTAPSRPTAGQRGLTSYTGTQGGRVRACTDCVRRAGRRVSSRAGRDPARRGGRVACTCVARVAAPCGGACARMLAFWKFGLVEDREPGHWRPDLWRLQVVNQKN